MDTTKEEPKPTDTSTPDGPGAGETEAALPGNSPSDEPAGDRVVGGAGADQAVDTSAHPPMPSLEQMVGSAVEAVPELALRRSAVEKVFVCYMTYVGSDQIAVIDTAPEIAKTELSLTRGWDPKEIEAACDDVINGLAEAWTGLANDFGSASEQGSDKTSEVLDFEMVARRFAAEQQEQDELRRRARELLTLVKTVSGQLGIPNPDSPTFGASDAEPDGEDGDHGRLAAGLRRLASPVVGFVTESKDDAPPIGSDADGGSAADAAADPAGWTTPPILSDDNQDIRTLEHVVARRAASDADIRLVWSGLEALGLDRNAVSELLGRVATLAREQIAQCAEILRNVTAQHRKFAARIESIQRMMGVTHAVHDYFFGPTGSTNK